MTRREIKYHMHRKMFKHLAFFIPGQFVKENDPSSPKVFYDLGWNGVVESDKPREPVTITLTKEDYNQCHE